MAEKTHQGEVAGTHWNPNQYLKFADHRLRPALELLDRVPLASPRVIYDLGCGSGNVTRLIAKRWPHATVYGLDNSPDMLAKSASESSHIRWVEADIRHWSPDQAPDLIYSNAALQWIDGHHDLFPRLMRFVAPSGCLAVQMPLSWDINSHRLMRDTLHDGGPGGTPLGDDMLRFAVARKWVDSADVYYDLLAGSASSVDIWETEYLQILDGEDPVLEWVKSTGLRPIMHDLDAASREVFLATYCQRLRHAYPTRPNGRTLYPFRRLFIVALRAAHRN